MLKEQDDEELLVLETDAVLMTDPKFRFIVTASLSLSAVMFILPVRYWLVFIQARLRMVCSLTHHTC